MTFSQILKNTSGLVPVFDSTAAAIHRSCNKKLLRNRVSGVRHIKLWNRALKHEQEEIQ